MPRTEPSNQPFEFDLGNLHCRIAVPKIHIIPPAGFSKIASDRKVIFAKKINFENFAEKEKIKKTEKEKKVVIHHAISPF